MSNTQSMVYLAEVSSTQVNPDIPTRVEVFNHSISLILRVRHTDLKNRGFNPGIHVMDNEAPTALKKRFFP